MKNKNTIAEGHVSIFDLQITETPKEVTKVEEKITENKVLSTEIINKITPKEIEKITKFLGPTKEQQKFLDKNNSMENENLSKIIIHAKGSMTIEIKESGIFTSHYITTEGKEELSYSNNAPVLPWDMVFYTAPKEVPLTEIQENKVQKLVNERKDIKRIIRRKGDVNIIAELPEGLISITPIGWELPYTSINQIDCSEHEIYLIPDKEVIEEITEDVGKTAKVGDYVQAMNGKKLIEGKLFSEYNAGDTFNIIFENGTKHTAIPRLAIKKILKSA